MSRKTRVKQLKQVLNDSSAGGINAMFEEMMGIRDAEPEIICPKFVKTRNLLRHVYKILLQFSFFAPLRSDFPEMSESLDQIKEFAIKLKENVYFSDDKDAEETEELYKNVPKVDLNNLYKKLKDNAIVKQLIILCGKLKQYSKSLNDSSDLKDNFIGLEPGLSFVIFPFSTLDLKKIWANSNVKPIVKKYILSILHYLYKDLYMIYKITTSPDVNIDKFTTLLLESISQLKKQPGLNRCNNAFKRIESSVALLKDKFEDYYRESIASENPNMIVESFIVDVSNQGGADARLTREFREIIRYMHKVGEQNGRNKDPNVQNIFKMLNQSFGMMEKKTEAKPSKFGLSGSKNIDDLDCLLDVKDNKEDNTTTNNTTTNNTTTSSTTNSTVKVSKMKSKATRDKRKGKTTTVDNIVDLVNNPLDNLLENPLDQCDSDKLKTE